MSASARSATETSPWMSPSASRARRTARSIRAMGASANGPGSTITSSTGSLPSGGLLEARAGPARRLRRRRAGHRRRLGQVARLRVVDALVVDARQHLYERLLHLGDLAQRERALVELAVAHLGPHDRVDQLADAVGGGILERARGGLHGVGQHRHRGLARLRLGPRIAVVLRVERVLAVLLDRLLPEEADPLGAVV